MNSKAKIYGAEKCGDCKHAKEFLKEKGIEFDSFDVTSDSDAFAEMRKISGGARSIPVIDVCGTVLVGYDRAELEKALECFQSNPL